MSRSGSKARIGNPLIVTSLAAASSRARCLFDDVGRRFDRGFVLEQGPGQDRGVQEGACPLHHRNGDGLAASAEDRGEYFWIAKGFHITAFLQLEAVLIDAA